MAFNGFLFGTIAPGAANAQRWFFKFGGNGDRGTQYITAHPLNPGGDLLVFDHSKKLENNGTFTYFVSVRNVGPNVTNFNWQGGGVT